MRFDLPSEPSPLASAHASAPAYTPNHISLDTRALYLVVSTLLITYAAVGLWVDDLYIWMPRRRGSIHMHLHGWPAWLAGAALASAAANLLSVVVDHYDRRNNENQYSAFARWSFISACALLMAAVFLHASTSRPVPGVADGRLTIALLPLVTASIGAAAAAAYVVLGLLAKECLLKSHAGDEAFGLRSSWCFHRSRYNSQGRRLCTWGVVSLALFVVCALVGALFVRRP